MKNFLLFCLFLAFIPVSYSQSAEKATLVQDLIGELKTVNTAKYTFDQQLEPQGDYILRFNSIKTSSKGKEEKHAYEFSMADIDKNTVSEQTKGDQIFVKLSCKAGKKLIKSFGKSNSVSYVSEFQIIAENIDNARAIKKIIKQIIPLAIEETEARLQATTYNELLSWLEENIGDADCGKTNYEQSLTQEDAGIGTVVFNQKKTSGSKETETKYTFNLSDLNARSISYSVKGSEMAISVETNARKSYIEAANDEKQMPYTSKIAIYVNDSEKAKDLKTALSRIIPLAKETLESALPKTDDLDELLSLLSDNVQEVSNNSINIQQQIEAQLITNYTTTTETSKATINNSYQFFIGDLDVNTVKTKISGIDIVTTVQIKAKKHYIKVVKNDIVQNYGYSIKIYCSNIENNRRLEMILKQLIPLAEDNYESIVPQGNASDKISWALEQVKEISDDSYTYEQSLELDDETTLKYTLIKSSSKKSTETIYECNYGDLNSKTVDLVVKGKQLFVKLNTKLNKKLINVYQDAEIKPYTNAFQIQFDDLEVARNFVIALKDAIEAYDEENDD